MNDKKKEPQDESYQASLQDFYSTQNMCDGLKPPKFVLEYEEYLKKRNEKTLNKTLKNKK